MTSEQREALRQSLIRDEGLRLKPYRCTAGKLTIGVGRNLDDGGITAQEAMQLLDHDINACLEDLAFYPWFRTLSPVRQNALVNMRFQLGPGGFRGFTQMLAALAAGDPVLAAEKARLSKWRREDAPARAERVCLALETGVEV